MKEISQRKIVQSLDFLEELSWFLKSNKSSKLDDVIEMIKALRSQGVNDLAVDDKLYLTGAISKFLNDKDLFPSNEDIVDFAVNALSIQIPRWEKRSRYELIGLVVCETDSRDGDSVKKVAKLLSIVSSDLNELNSFKNLKKSGLLSWNDAIRRMND